MLGLENVDAHQGCRNSGFENYRGKPLPYQVKMAEFEEELRSVSLL